MIFLVLGERERPRRVARYFRGGQARNEKRDGARVLFERRTVAQMELLLFPAHHHRIKNCEVNHKDQCRFPRARGKSGPKSQDSAAEIERVSGVSVGSGDGEDFLLVKIAGCVRAHRQTNDTRQGALQNAARCGARKSKNRERERITEAHAPMHKKIAGRAHPRTSTCRRTASKTVSTSLSRMEVAGWPLRL